MGFLPSPTGRGGRGEAKGVKNKHGGGWNMNGKQEKRETWQTYHDLKNKYHRFQIERKRESTVLPFAVAAH